VPLTIAHPAAVIPLAGRLGRRVSLSALVIGSMSPDFAYLLPLGLVRMQTHDPWALLWFCLPAGLAAYALFHLVLGPISARLFPAEIATRLPPSAFSGKLPAVPFHAVAASILIGAASHLVVDSMTHRDGFVVQRIPLLQTYLGSIGGYRVYVCKILQHVFSIIGLALIWSWIRTWVRRTPSAPDHAPFRFAPGLRIAGLCMLIAAPIAVGAFASAQLKGTGQRVVRIRDRSRAFLKGSGTMLCVNWITLGLVLRMRRSPGDSSPDERKPRR